MNMLTLYHKIVVFQWVIGFLGAWMIFSMVTSSTLEIINSSVEIEARIVETYPIIKKPESLEMLKPFE